MKSLNLALTIAAGILLGAALLPLVPIIAIVVGSYVLGHALQVRYHAPVAKLVDNPLADESAPSEELTELARFNDEFLRRHAPGPASKYFNPPAEEAHRWN